MAWGSITWCIHTHTLPQPLKQMQGATNNTPTTLNTHHTYTTIHTTLATLATHTEFCRALNRAEYPIVSKHNNSLRSNCTMNSQGNLFFTRLRNHVRHTVSPYVIEVHFSRSRKLLAVWFLQILAGISYKSVFFSWNPSLLPL